MIQNIGSWLIAIAAVYPVAFRLAEVGGKPVDAVLSDFLYLLILLTPPRKLLTIPAGVDLRILATVRVSALVCIAYSLALSLVGYAVSTEFMRVVSALKFLKPVTFVLLGAYLAMIFPPLLLLRRIATAFAIVSLATMVTTVALPSFPYCRWGNYLFGWEVYGYPNGAMTFYGMMVPLLVALSDLQRRQSLRIIYRCLTLVTMLVVVASLSRSSTMAMIVGLALYLFMTGRGYLVVLAAAAGAIIVVAGTGLLRLETNIEWISVVQSAIEGRVIETIQREDTFSGRSGIWSLALELWSERPVFGYAFESFSNYSRIYDTTHQMYLEVVYKTGLAGGVLYLWMLASGLIGICHLAGRAQAKSAPFYLLYGLLGTYVGVLVGNFSQGNLSGSLIGNVIFFMLGLVLTRHGAAELVEAPALPASPPKPVSLEIRNVQPGTAPT